MANRPRGKPFVKGDRGNPNGRPPKSANLAPSERVANRDLSREVRKLCRDVGPEAIKKLIAWMRSPKIPIGLRADIANNLLDRGFGKAAQTVDISATVDITVTESDPLELIEGRIAGYQARLGDARDPERPN